MLVEHRPPAVAEPSAPLPRLSAQSGQRGSISTTLAARATTRCRITSADRARCRARTRAKYSARQRTAWRDPLPPFLSPAPVPTSTLALTRTRRRQLLSLHSLARRGLPGSRPTSGYPALPDAGLEQRGSSPYRQMHARAWHHVHQQRHTNMQGLQSALRVPGPDFGSDSGPDGSLECVSTLDTACSRGV